MYYNGFNVNDRGNMYFLYFVSCVFLLGQHDNRLSSCGKIKKNEIYLHFIGL